MSTTDLGTGGQNTNLFSGYNIDNTGTISQVQVNPLTSDNVTTQDSTGATVTPTANYTTTTASGAIALTPPAAGGSSLTLADIQQINLLLNGPSTTSTNQTETVTSPPAQNTPFTLEQLEQGQAESDYGNSFVSAATTNGVSLDNINTVATQVNTETTKQLQAYFQNPPGSNLTSTQQLQVILSIQAPGNPDIQSPQDPAVAAAVTAIQANLAADQNIPSWALNNLPSAEQIGADQETYGDAFTNAALLNNTSPDQIPVVAENVNQEMTGQLSAFFGGAEVPQMTPDGTTLTPEEQVQVLFQVLVPDGDVAANLSPNVAAAVKNLRSLLANDPNIPTWLQTTPPASSLLPQDPNSVTGQFLAQMANQNDTLFEQALSVATLNGQPLTTTQQAILEYAHYNPQYNAQLPPDMAAVLASCESQFQSVYGFGASYIAPTNTQSFTESIDGAFATNLSVALLAVTPALTDQEIVDISQYASNPSSAPAQYQTLLTNAVASATAATQVEFPGLPSSWVPTVFPTLTVDNVDLAKTAKTTLGMLNEQADTAETYISSMPSGSTQNTYLEYLTLVRGALAQAQNSQYIIQNQMSQATVHLTDIQNLVQQFGETVSNDIQKTIDAELAKLKADAPHGWLQHFEVAMTVACLILAACIVTAFTGPNPATAMLWAFVIAYSVDAIQADARGQPSEFQQGMNAMQASCEKTFPGEGGRVFATIMTCLVLGAICLINPEVMATVMMTNSNIIALFTSCLPLSPAQAAKCELVLTYVLLVATIGSSLGSLAKTMGKLAGKLWVRVCEGAGALMAEAGRAMGKTVARSASELTKSAVLATKAAAEAEGAAAKAAELAVQAEKLAKDGCKKFDDLSDEAKTKDPSLADDLDVHVVGSAGSDMAGIQKRIDEIAESGADDIQTLTELNTLKKNLMKIRGQILDKIAKAQSMTNKEVDDIKAAMGKMPTPGSLAKVQEDAAKFRQVATDLRAEATRAEKLAADANQPGTIAKGVKKAQEGLDTFKAGAKARWNKIANGPLGRGLDKVTSPVRRGVNKVTSSDTFKALTYNVSHNSEIMEGGSAKLAEMLGISKDALKFDEFMNKAFLLVGIATSAMEIQGDKIDFDNAMINKEVAELTERMNIVDIDVKAEVTNLTSVIQNLQTGIANTSQTIVDIGGMLKSILDNYNSMAYNISTALNH